MNLIECPRDAMQGMTSFIPTADKIRYIQSLLRVGFDTIDFGSFVSPKAIPQLRDTAEVLGGLDLSNTSSKLLAIVANTRGASDALQYEAIDYLGFPLSLSETFQQRNTNKRIAEALETVREIRDLCERHGKKLVTYLSMGFGNPYGDPYSVDTVAAFVERLRLLGSDVVSLADTIGVAKPDQIHALFTSLTRDFPTVALGVHLHSNPSDAWQKIDAAWTAGCRRFDSAVRGFGGCPMADDDLVGNIATETLLSYLHEKKIATNIGTEAFAESVRIADEIFPKH